MTAYPANDNSDDTAPTKGTWIKAHHAYVAVVVLAIAFTGTYRTLTFNATVNGYGIVAACLTPTGTDHELCHRQIDRVTEMVAKVGYEGKKACPPGDINHDRLVNDIIANLSYNPDILIRSAENLIASAAIKAFPCRLNSDTTRTIE